MDAQSKKPSVFDYLNISQYLQDYYHYRKSLQRQFSYESWAQELNFNSRSFLRMIVSGKKKVSPRLAEAFANQVFSHRSETEFFNLLVQLDHAKSSSRQREINSKLLRLLKHEMGATTIQDSTSEFISDPLLPRLLAALGFKDFQSTTEACAALFQLPEEVVYSKLVLLEKLDLVSRSSNNHGEQVWVAKTDSFYVPDNYGSFDALKFHQLSLESAIEAFKLAPSLRKYRSLIFPLTDEETKRLNQMLEGFLDEVLLRCHSNSCADRRMFQLNLNFHAITEKFEALTEDLHFV